MYLPKKNTAPEARIRHAKYVARALRIENRQELADAVNASAESIRQALRAVQDVDDKLSELFADRDGVDRKLDVVGGAFRLALASRAPTAMREAPYSDIYHRGAAWVAAAPIDANAERYRELLTRAQTYLPADDAALLPLITGIPPLIEEWESRVQAVEEARVQLALAAASVDKAEDNYDRLIDQVAAQLIADLGKAATRQIFRGAKR